MSSTNISELTLYISGLEERQKNLLEKRKQALSELQQINSNYGFKNTHKKTKNFHKLENEPIQKKIRPADDFYGKNFSAGNSELRDNRDPNLRRENDQFEKPNEVKQPLKKPEEIVKRDRNMFGNLLNHLKKAKNVLRSQNELFTKQKQVSEIADERNSQLALNLKEKQKIQNQERKKIGIEQKQEAENELIKLECDLTQARFDKTCLEISNFIQTKTTPQIFWKPTQNNSNIDQLLQESKENILKRKEEKKAIQKEKILEILQENKKPEEASEDDDTKSQKQDQKDHQANSENDKENELEKQKPEEQKQAEIQ